VVNGPSSDFVVSVGFDLESAGATGLTAFWRSLGMALSKPEEQATVLAKLANKINVTALRIGHL